MQHRIQTCRIIGSLIIRHLRNDRKNRRKKERTVAELILARLQAHKLSNICGQFKNFKGKEAPWRTQTIRIAGSKPCLSHL
mmetsp:Transcript_76836/g.152040  ORF Transcript_76836/g.152040 Transcript_76836/m.152040 type:complete len:81 (+) Transcript_76836:100-342(+)